MLSWLCPGADWNNMATQGVTVGQQECPGARETGRSKTYRRVMPLYWIYSADSSTPNRNLIISVLYNGSRNGNTDMLEIHGTTVVPGILQWCWVFYSGARNALCWYCGALMWQTGVWPHHCSDGGLAASWSNPVPGIQIKPVDSPGPSCIPQTRYGTSGDSRELGSHWDMYADIWTPYFTFLASTSVMFCWLTKIGVTKNMPWNMLLDAAPID